MAPKIDDHDIDTKIKAAARFLDEGDKLKVTVRFRGRELAHPDRGRTLLLDVGDKLKEHGTIERMPLLEGRQMIMVMNPVRRDAQTGAPAPAGGHLNAAANTPRSAATPPSAASTPAETASGTRTSAPPGAGVGAAATPAPANRPTVPAAPAAPRAPASRSARPLP